MNKEILEKKKVIELREILRERKLKIGGNKEELIKRILDYPVIEDLSNFRILQFPLDILRIIALKLSIKDIINLCQTNKRFKLILEDKNFWEQLLLREIDEVIIIPTNITINWYKKRIKYWKGIKIITDLIKDDIEYDNNKTWKPKKVWFNFTKPYNKDWTRFEIVDNLIMLACNNLKLTSLPSMPNLESLHCCNNKLISLHHMPKLRELYCIKNQLTKIPSYPELVNLHCQDNQIRSIHSLPKLRELYCGNNRLTSLPKMPNLQRLYCKNNPLPDSTLKYWRITWKYPIARIIT